MFLQPIDRLLNRITIYKLVAWSLSLMLIVAIIYSAIGVLSLKAGGLALTVLVLGLVCYVSNQLFSKLFRVAANSESFLITAMILACIVAPINSVSRALAVAAVGVIAMAIKYLLVFRGSHFVNPAAAAALIGSLTGILPITWWIGSPPMLPFTLLLGLLILRKTRRFELFLSFAIAGVLMMLLVGGIAGTPVTTTLSNAILSWPLIFLGTIMLTEPTTLPAGRLHLMLYGLLVGTFYGCQLHVGILSAAPHTALIVGNLFSLIVSPKQSLQVRLKRRTKLGTNIYDLVFEQPAGKRLSYQPGQYTEWTLPHKRADVRGNRRTFSLASSPTESELHIGIKTYEPSSSFKRTLLALEPGSYIQVGHVGGSFTLPDDPSRKLLFVAGGIGITPFRSMLQYLIDTKQKRDIILIYSVRDKAEVAYKDVLQAAKQYSLRLAISTEQLTTDSLAKAVPDVSDREVYISGPNAMVHATEALVGDSGVARRDIHTDYFSGY